MDFLALIDTRTERREVITPPGWIYVEDHSVTQYSDADVIVIKKFLERGEYYQKGVDSSELIENKALAALNKCISGIDREEIKTSLVKHSRQNLGTLFAICGMHAMAGNKGSSDWKNQCNVKFTPFHDGSSWQSGVMKMVGFYVLSSGRACNLVNRFRNRYGVKTVWEIATRYPNSLSPDIRAKVEWSQKYPFDREFAEFIQNIFSVSNGYIKRATHIDSYTADAVTAGSTSLSSEVKQGVTPQTGGTAGGSAARGTSPVNNKGKGKPSAASESEQEDYEEAGDQISVSDDFSVNSAVNKAIESNLEQTAKNLSFSQVTTARAHNA